MLNCKNPLLYQDIYKKTIEKHQKKSLASSDNSFSQFEEPEIDLDNPLIQTLLDYNKKGNNEKKTDTVHEEEVVGLEESKESN